MHGFSLALAAFVLIHVGISATGLRRAIVARIGETRYRIGFGAVSIILLIWLIQAYAAMRSNPADPLNALLWAPPVWAHYPAYALILLGFLMAVPGLFTPGPTQAGFDHKLVSETEPVRGILRVTRHPFLWGVALWAAGHLLLNGERFALMLFGALGLMALLGTRSIDRKGAARNPENWARIEAATSNIPFAAILQKRNRFAFAEIGWRWIAALAVIAIVVWAHGPVIGVPAFSTPR